LRERDKPRLQHPALDTGDHQTMSFSATSAWNTSVTPLAASDGMAHAQGGWNAMPAEAGYAVHPTLEEKAWCARLATAAIDAHMPPDMHDGGSYFA
jgi:hypothetical protein